MKDCYDFICENNENGTYWGADCMGGEPQDNDGCCACIGCPSASECYGIDLEDGDDEFPDEVPTTKTVDDAWAKSTFVKYSRMGAIKKG